MVLFMGNFIFFLMLYNIHHSHCQFGQSSYLCGRKTSTEVFLFINILRVYKILLVCEDGEFFLINLNYSTV